MPKFMMKARFTAPGLEGVRAEGGSARREVVLRAIESVGGRLESFNFGFGKYDTYTVMDLPDNESAAALSLAVSASGAVATRITVLLTPEEVDAAAKRSVEYRPPSS